MDITDHGLESHETSVNLVHQSERQEASVVKADDGSDVDDHDDQVRHEKASTNFEANNQDQDALGDDDHALSAA